jgi:hypothetical protein
MIIKSIKVDLLNESSYIYEEEFSTESSLLQIRDRIIDDENGNEISGVF